MFGLWFHRYPGWVVGMLWGMVLVGIVTVLPAFPANEAISLQDALKLADSNNPQLLAAQKNYAASKADIDMAKYVPNPQLNTVFSAGDITSQLGNPQQVGMTQTLETGGKRHQRVLLAQAQYTLTDFQYNALRWDIHTQVRKAYAELAAAMENATNLDLQASLLGDLVDIADKRFKAGVAPEAEVEQAELNREQLDSQRNQAQDRIEQARLQLNALLGNQLQADYEISDNGLFQSPTHKSQLVPTADTVLPAKDTLYHEALRQRLDLQAALQQKTVSTDQLAVAKSGRMPDLQLSGGYLFVTAPSPENNIRRYFDGPYAGVTVNLPLFHNQQAEMAKAKASIEQNQLQVNALQQQIHLDIDTSYSSLQVARQNILLFQTQLLPHAKNVLHLAQRSYQVGKTGLANVILAQQTVQQIAASYLDSLVDYQNAWGDLEKAVGGPINLP